MKSTLCYFVYVSWASAILPHSLGFPILNVPAGFKRQDNSSGASPSQTVSDVLPEATASIDISPDLPPDIPQPWCPSKIFCPGDFLQEIQLTQLFVDSKTFVDKPTKFPTEQVLENFNTLSNKSSESFVQFVEDNFIGENSFVIPADLEGYTENPQFLQGIKDPIVNGWMKLVHSYWAKLTRRNDMSGLCDGCESTLIPSKNPFIVPGGRFREFYYWDTYFALEGALISELETLYKGMMENYLDILDTIGFIPNGARTYYLDRSQPPLFTRMFWNYLQGTNDTSLLDRALPLLEKEMAWWETNRTLEITSPYTGKTHKVTRYAVVNSAPRPEGYVPDFKTVNGDDVENPGIGISEERAAELYANLASGAESGVDFASARWSTEPLLNRTDNLPALRTLNLINQIPVDVNSILYEAYELIANMHEYGCKSCDASKSKSWRESAAKRKEAVLDLFWDPERLHYYDFNTTANARGTVWTASSYFAYFNGIYPDEVANDEEKAKKAFASIGHILANYNGSIPTTMMDTGLQWDFPNVWPPHARVIAGAIQNIPDQVSKSPYDQFSKSVANYDFMPKNQIGIEKQDLPPQPWASDNQTFVQGVTAIEDLGNSGPTQNAKNWRDGLMIAHVNRYVTSAFCSWYDTGGSIPDILERLPNDQISGPDPETSTGQMFEKFDATDIDASGSGGEYIVQDGFGWTNGFALWIGKNYGDNIDEPTCPPR